MSLETQIKGLKLFFKHTKSKGQGRKLKKRSKRTMIFSLKIFEEKT
jgi:hypothetical protein